MNYKQYDLKIFPNIYVKHTHTHTHTHTCRVACYRNYAVYFIRKLIIIGKFYKVKCTIISTKSESAKYEIDLEC